MSEPPEKEPSLTDRVRGYFRKPPSTTLTIVIAVLAVFVAGGVAAGVGFLVVNPLTSAANDLPNSALIAGGVGVALGLLTAWLGAFFYYRLRAYTTRLELQNARRDLSQIDRAKDTLGRMEIYADHIYLILESLVADAQSLHNLSLPDTERDICGVPQEYLSEGTGLQFLLSVWVEPGKDPSTKLGRAANRIRGTIQDRVGEPLAATLPGGPRFQILAGRIDKDERDAFEVRVESSWLKHRQSGEEDEPYPDNTAAESVDGSRESKHARRRQQTLERFVYGAEAPYTKLTGGDINGFKRFNYASVRAISSRRDGRVCYLVALSKAENAFTEAEDLYLLWLRRVLQLDSVAGVEPPLQDETMGEDPSG